MSLFRQLREAPSAEAPLSRMVTIMEPDPALKAPALKAKAARPGTTTRSRLRHPRAPC